MKKRSQYSTVKRQQSSSPVHPSSFIPHPSIRRGSILILVIALLVMLALIGTAFISTTRIDRESAAQGTANTQTDLFATSVQNLAVNAIVNDMFSAAGPLRTSPEIYQAAPTSTTFSPVTSPVSSKFLASRVPSVVTPGTAYNPLTNPVVWEWISAPLSGGNFEDPTTLAAWNSVALATTDDRFNPRINFKLDPLTNTKYPAFVLASGGSAIIAGDADGDGIADCGLVRLGAMPGPQFSGVTFYYGVRIVDGNSAVNVNTAWTSGNDGAPTALAAQAGLSTTANGLRNNRLTPASIGLREMLNSFTVPQEFDFSNAGLSSNSLNLYRYGLSSLNDPGTVAATIPFRDYDQTSASGFRTFSPIQRDDFVFISQLDAFSAQLGSRTGFPGYSGGPTATNLTAPAVRFQAIPSTDTATLAHRFCLANASTGQSLTEQYLHSELYNTPFYDPKATTPTLTVGAPAPIADAPYSPDAFGNWFSDNFDYQGGTANMPLRALLVSYNPVLTVAPYHAPPAPNAPYIDTFPATTSPEYMTNPQAASVTTTGKYLDRGAWTSTAIYALGDVVHYTDVKIPPAVSVDSHAYVCIGANTGKNPDTTAGFWRSQQWSTSPTKVDVNSESFEGLWRAYYNVMVNSVTAAPAAPTSPFNSPLLIPPASSAQVYDGNHFPGSPVTNQARMFRTPIRDGASYLNDGQMVLLRSAIAAANAEHMRAVSQKPSDDTITPHTIQLATTPIGGGATTNVNVEIYPACKQLFLTELYVSQDLETGANAADPNNPPGVTGANNPTGYIAIEFYNPSNVPIDIKGWQFALLPRTAAPHAIDQATFPVIATSTVVKPRGFLLVENYAGPGGGAGAAYRPPASGLPTTGNITATNANVTVLTVTNLDAVLGKELVLLRPLGVQLNTGNGNMESATAGTNALPAIPSDSFDFTGFLRGSAVTRDPAVPHDPTVAGQTAIAHAYYYARRTNGTAIGAMEWQFVYPGHYDGGGATYHQEIIAEQWDVVTTQTDPADNTKVIQVAPYLQDPWAAGIDVTSPKTTFPTASGSGPTLTYGDLNSSQYFVAFTPTFGISKTNTSIDAGNGVSTGLSFTIQLGGTGIDITGALSGFGGPNPLHTYAAANPQKYPFGGFMREADLLQIPFIGSYVIYTTAITSPAVQAATFVEMNSISMDAAFADDTDPNDDFEENVGRFCPIVVPNAIPNNIDGGNNSPISEFSGIPAATRYGWATRLFDYLTVRSAQHMPNANAQTYATATNSPYDAQPVPHSASAAKSNPTVQGEEPPVVDGLVNINTAPYSVLAAIPWVAPNNPNAGAINKLIANNILTYRSGKYLAGDGASLGLTRKFFHTTAELNRIQKFRTNEFDTAAQAASPPAGKWGIEPTGSNTAAAFTAAAFKTHDNGDFSPITPATASTDYLTGKQAAGVAGTFANDTSDGVINDFESQFLQLSAVSNLITTRSDTFTVYIVIEGWTNVGTAQAQRVTQRRLAFLVDRTGVTSSNNRVVKITPVSTD